MLSLPSKDELLYIPNRWTSTTVPHDLFSFFVCNSEKFIVWCISAKENYYNLTKNCHKFQTSVAEKCILSVSILDISAKSFQSTCKRVESLKNLSQFLKFHQNFFHLFIHLFTEACLCNYSTHILYLYSFLNKVLLTAFTIPEIESKRKISLSFWITVAPSQRFALDAGKVKPSFCFNALRKRSGSYSI